MVAEQQRLLRLGRGVDDRRIRQAHDLRQFLAQFLAQLVVEIGERLVEQDEIGALDQRAGHGGALLLAAGEVERHPLQEGLELHQPRHLRGTLPSISALGRPLTLSGEAMFSKTLRLG